MQTNTSGEGWLHKAELVQVLNVPNTMMREWGQLFSVSQMCLIWNPFFMQTSWD